MNAKLVGLGALALPPLLTIAVAFTAMGSGALDTSNTASTGCQPAATDPGQGTASLTSQTLDAAQLGNARIIYAVAAQRGLPQRAAIIALGTALQESTLRNLSGGDRDSLGLFQQRPSQGWGTSAQILNPVYASNAFYTHLIVVPNWQALPIAEAAQAVQRSSFGDAYAKWGLLASQLANSIGATTTSTSTPITGVASQCTSGCPETTRSGEQPAQTTGCRDATAVFARAATWLSAWNGGPVPYLSSGDPTTWLGGYRRDCSGYVSMALGLPGPGLDGRGLAARSTLIIKAALAAGDLLINSSPGDAGHVVIFERWTDTTMTSYVGYEQSGDGGTHHRRIPYPYFGGYPMSLYR